MAQTWSISAVADVGSPAATSARKEPKELFATSLRLRSTLSSVHCAPLDDVATKAFVPCCSSKSDAGSGFRVIIFSQEASCDNTAHGDCILEGGSRRPTRLDATSAVGKFGHDIRRRQRNE